MTTPEQPSPGVSLAQAARELLGLALLLLGTGAVIAVAFLADVQLGIAAAGAASAALGYRLTLSEE